MSSNPYENEPGYEDAKSPEDKIMMAHYIAKVVYNDRPESMVWLLMDTRFNTKLYGLR